MYVVGKKNPNIEFLKTPKCIPQYFKNIALTFAVN